MRMITRGESAARIGATSTLTAASRTAYGRPGARL